MVKRTSMERAADAEDPNLRVNECNICSATIDEQAGDINGYFGILPISFCVWCISSITDMVIQMNGFNDIETLEERIQDLKDEYQ
jgi:hypothetical protein